MMAKKGANVLLIYPPTLYASGAEKKLFIKPHLLSLFSYLKHHNIKVNVLDLQIELRKPRNETGVRNFLKRIYELISRFDFDIAAISCWTSYDYLGTVMVAEVCRTIKSECIIVVGGYHPTAVPADFIYQKSLFNFVIQGEGEIALLKICEGKEKKDKRPKLIQGTPLELSDDFILDWQNYPYQELYLNNCIYLSRGCPFNCTFCLEPSKCYRKWRSYSVEKSICEIKRIIKINQPRQIAITDACFGFSKQWRKQFLTELIKHNIKNIFWIMTRIDLIDEQDIDLMSKLRVHLVFGLETCSDEMLVIMRKTNNPSKYLQRCKELISCLNENKIFYEIFLIFNHPGETYQTYKRTIEFLKSIFIKQDKISGIIRAQNYAFFPGSYVHYNLSDYEKKYGTIIKHKEWWKERAEQDKLARDLIPSDELRDLIAKTNHNYWQKEIKNLNHYCVSKMPLRTKTYFFSKFKTFKIESTLIRKVRKILR